MLARTACCLFGLILPLALCGVVLAGEGAPPPKVGDVIRASDQKPQGSITGWVRWGRGSMLCLCVEQIAGEKRRPGDDFEIWARYKAVEGKDRPQPEEKDVAAIRLFGAGDRLEVEWVQEDKRARVVSIKLLAKLPHKGVLAGKVTGLENKEKSEEREWFDLRVSAAPQGFEYLKEQTVRFYADWINTGDEKKGRRGWIPNPEQCKAIGLLQDGDLLEVGYKADGRLRPESVKQTGRAEPEKRPEPERQPRSDKPHRGGDPEPD